MRPGSSDGPATSSSGSAAATTSWQPFHSGYRDYREYARGAGWAVWVGLPGNPEPRQAPLKGALPIPEYREPASIEVPDWLLR